MASDLRIFPASLARSVAQAVSATSAPGKSQAGCVALAAAIGTSWRLRLRRGGVVVLDLVFQSALSPAGGAIVLPAYSTLLELVAADIDTPAYGGVISSSGWTCRIGKSDDSVYVEGSVGPASSAAPFKLSNDLDTAKGIALSGLTMRFDPALDASTPSSAVDQMVAHMSPNIVTLNAPPDRNAMKGGVVVVGGDLRSAAVPTWWGGSVYYPPTYGPTYWATLQPWYVVWDIVGHQAGLNVHCAIRKLKLWWLSSDAPTTWQVLSESVAPPGDPFARDAVNTGGDAIGVLGPSGAYWATKIDPSGGIYHGYQGQVSSPAFDPAKILGLHVQVMTAKVLQNASGPDNRSLARYAVQVGVDAYPYSGAPLPAAPNNYWPGCASSRYEEVTNDWKAVYGTTLVTARAVDNGSRAGSYSSRQTMTEAAFRASPPPAHTY